MSTKASCWSEYMVYGLADVFDDIGDDADDGKGVSFAEFEVRIGLTAVFGMQFDVAVVESVQAFDGEFVT